MNLLLGRILKLGCICSQRMPEVSDPDLLWSPDLCHKQIQASAMKHILAMANNCTECVMPGHEDERRLAIAWALNSATHHHVRPPWIYEHRKLDSQA